MTMRTMPCVASVTSGYRSTRPGWLQHRREDQSLDSLVLCSTVQVRTVESVSLPLA